MDHTKRYPSPNRRTEVYGHQPPTKIGHNLWQGGWPTQGELERLNITAIINVTGGSDPLPEERVIKCLNFTFGDGTLPDLDVLHKVAQQGVAWVNAGERVLVHCAAGWNRSGLTMGLILILLHGMKGAKAVRLIRRKRIGALGNSQFRVYLEKYELDPDGLAARMVSPFKVWAPPAKPFSPTLVPWEDEKDDLFPGWEDDLFLGSGGKDYFSGLMQKNALAKGVSEA